MAVVSEFEVGHRAKLEALAPGLSGDIGRITALDPCAADRVLEYLLGLACQAQHMEPIRLGRVAIGAIPRDWLLPRVMTVAKRCLDLEDEWDVRRLLELCRELSDPLFVEVVSRALRSRNPDVVEAAREFQPAASRKYEYVVLRPVNLPARPGVQELSHTS